MFPIPTVPILRLYFKPYHEPKQTKLLIPISEKLVQHLKPFLSSSTHKTYPTYVTTIKAEKQLMTHGFPNPYSTILNQFLPEQTPNSSTLVSSNLVIMFASTPGGKPRAARRCIPSGYFQILPNASDFTILPSTRLLISPRSYSNTIKTIRAQIQWSINPTIVSQYPISHHN